MANTAIPEGLFPVRCLEPATDAAGRTGDWIKLANAGRAYIVFFTTQAAANTILISVLQASAAAGTGSKAISAVAPIWACLDCNTTDALVRATDGTTYTTSAGTTHKIIVIEIDPAKHLDMANGFNWITVSTGASAAGNLTSALIMLTDLRFAQVTPPTAIA